MRVYPIVYHTEQSIGSMLSIQYSISIVKKQTGSTNGVEMGNRSDNVGSLALPQPMNEKFENIYRPSTGWIGNCFDRTTMMMILIVLLTMSSAAVHAETILLDELLPELGLQSLAPELKYIKKGGRMTASLHNPSNLTSLGFSQLKQFDRIRLENL